MTNLIPWILANLQFIAIIASIALVFLILMAGIGIWALGWYFWRLFAGIHAEPEPKPYPYGDVIRLPDDYWKRVAEADDKRAKERAG